MQLMPGTARDVALDLGVSDLHTTDRIWKIIALHKQLKQPRKKRAAKKKRQKKAAGP